MSVISKDGEMGKMAGYRPIKDATEIKQSLKQHALENPELFGDVDPSKIILPDDKLMGLELSMAEILRFADLQCIPIEEVDFAEIKSRIEQIMPDSAGEKVSQTTNGIFMIRGGNRTQTRTLKTFHRNTPLQNERKVAQIGTMLGLQLNRIATTGWLSAVNGSGVRFGNSRDSKERKALFEFGQSVLKAKLLPEIFEFEPVVVFPELDGALQSGQESKQSFGSSGGNGLGSQSRQSRS